MRFSVPDYFEHATSPLHEERLNAVFQVLIMSGARTVLDLGCGPGPLLLRLYREPQFEKILAVDTSAACLRQAQDRLRGEYGVGDVAFLQASFTSREERLTGFDAAVMVETIEHVDPDRLSAVENAVFGCYRPKTVVITTPNHEFNGLLDVPEGRFRHKDHRFEWSRAKFEAWVRGVGTRAGYAAAIEGIGFAHPILGSPTQMAILRRVNSER